ncbi:MAG TPA: phosphoribosylamine--glycine ligase [Candidatus Peribacteraceae bacterium]|nr:phosphoribosylamine--glycine ligase [Candidatus Peribacteraceae bacterium]
MKILLVTSSARGHAIAEALARSPQKPEIISISPNRNPGLRALAKDHFQKNIMDFPAILEIAKNEDIDFAVIGPDDPIGAGLADALEGIGIKSVAPKKRLAQIETSKAFTRHLLQKHGIDASPKFQTFEVPPGTHIDKRSLRRELTSYIEEMLESNYVVKYDALKGGKGVRVSGEHLDTVEDGVDYALECIEECGRVVIEEKLIGIEFSLLSFVSGTQVVDMPAVQDHKRAYEGDTGPNTGGMGTYSDTNHSLPFLEKSDLARAKELNRLTAAALQKETGEPYKGILYGGFIAVKNGIRLIEYNARFGDPEALNILPLLSSDFVNMCKGIIDGELTESLVTFEKKATVCKYITPHGYPENKDQKGKEVKFPEMPENARLYFGDITQEHDGRLTLGGSRSAGIVGIGNTIVEAEKIAEDLCKQVEGPVRFRSDIGTKDLIEQRIKAMKSLRNS